MATCAGCGMTHEACGYDDEDDVLDDGSYANGKFVCDQCYIQLIQRGLDIGSAEQLQERIVAVRKGLGL